MLCVLRLEDKNLDEAKIASAFGSRVTKARQKSDDRAENNYLNVYVAESDDRLELAQAIHDFLKDHERGLRELHSTIKELDIGLLLRDHMASSSFELSPTVMTLCGSLGLTVAVSIYRASG